MSRVRIATRGSDLALAQARWVAGRVGSELGAETELVILTTTGDRIQDVSLAKIGGKGLFVKEIEEALLDGRADVAVHSAKDLPAAVPEALLLAAYPQRVDPRDALVGRAGVTSLASLPRGARVGTGSARRSALLRAYRADLELVPLRGNVPTRLEKLAREGLDAAVLACAGLERLGLADRIDERIATETLLPAICQGTLALETRADDPLAANLLALEDPRARVAADAERAFLTRLEGDCQVPIAAYAQPDDRGRVRMRGLVAEPSGASVVHVAGEAAVEKAAALGTDLAERALAEGAADILAAIAAGAAD